MRSSLSIQLNNVGKQFYQRWLFQGLTVSLHQGDRLALIGTNGSGKSTLLRIIAGQLSPTVGTVFFFSSGQKVPADQRYHHIAWSAPYISVFPELSFREQIRLQLTFQKFLIPEHEMIRLLELDKDADKPLRYFSSGMLQRAKVGLALFADSRLLLLDEPTSNMDQYHGDLTMDLIRHHLDDRILILASNLSREYGEIPRQIHLGIKEA